MQIKALFLDALISQEVVSLIPTTIRHHCQRGESFQIEAKREWF